MSRVASSRLVYDASEAVRQWAGIQLGLTFVEPCYALGVLNREGRLVGAVIYNGYEQRNVEATAVGRFGRHATAEICSYAFDHLGCRRISLTIHENNARLIRMMIRMGFEIEGVKRHFYEDNGHAIILGMLRESCKVLNHDTRAKTVGGNADAIKC